ncbi:MAG: hypothetical protein HYV63_29485 [Candidatus Schekmanbacteria bacterium]|nr:hypothetical protein [Candidatus Schekmanbacteria bacterium]
MHGRAGQLACSMRLKDEAAWVAIYRSVFPELVAGVRIDADCAGYRQAVDRMLLNAMLGVVRHWSSRPRLVASTSFPPTCGHRRIRTMSRVADFRLRDVESAAVLSPLMRIDIVELPK